MEKAKTEVSKYENLLRRAVGRPARLDEGRMVEMLNILEERTTVHLGQNGIEIYGKFAGRRNNRAMYAIAGAIVNGAQLGEDPHEIFLQLYSYDGYSDRPRPDPNPREILEDFIIRG